MQGTSGVSDTRVKKNRVFLLPFNTTELFIVHLSNNKKQAVVYYPDLVIKDILLKICRVKKLDMADYVAQTLEGNDIDIGKTLGELGLKRVNFKTVHHLCYTHTLASYRI
eukprot:TRINITY_DN3354_c0_g1_i1.p1 TRINITY_DN3354_c0_g1~~TRINITY_DN3354_c0_g1_i1.p1  ORF type:complete len:110 (+),score=8.84 TRINITY_DN3354_c0_g1_i1:102-431(+)